MTRVPAELRDGCYVKPYALLEVEQLWAGRREVWTRSHGRATRYHVMVDRGVAACRPFRDGRGPTTTASSSAKIRWFRSARFRRTWSAAATAAGSSSTRS